MQLQLDVGGAAGRRHACAREHPLDPLAQQDGDARRGALDLRDGGRRPRDRGARSEAGALERAEPHLHQLGELGHGFDFVLLRNGVVADRVEEARDAGLHVGIGQIAVDVARHGPRAGADQLDLVVDADFLACGEVLHDEVVVARGFVPDQELVGHQRIAHRREARLREHRHGHRLAARLVGAALRFLGAIERGQREYLHQVEGDVDARRGPGVVEEEAVAVVVAPELQVDPRQQAHQGLARLVGRDAAAVALFGHFGPHLQREALELLDVGGEIRHLPRVARHRRYAQLASGRRVDQHREIDLGLREIGSPEGNLLTQIQQRTAQRRRLHRRQELARLDEARLVDRLVDLGEQAVGGGQKPLRGLGAPPGDAHVVHECLHRLAAALRRDQLLVRELAGAVIADAEIEQVPGKPDARRGTRSLHRGGRCGGNGAVGGEAESK